MSSPDRCWSIVVHGGARTISEDERAQFEQGCLEAVTRAAEMLGDGGTAMDAAEAAVRILEDLPAFNAGNSSVLNADGLAEMDAAIMDGETLALGGVAAIRNILNPIKLARALLEETPTLLVGEGAQRFAKQIGVPEGTSDPRNDSHAADTVGCVARDMNGHLAAAGSTGGLSGKKAGRVGDTPLPGCGLYADDQMGAAALSGDGEVIARAMLAARALHLLASNSPTAAAQRAIAVLERTGGEAGIILIDPAGKIGIAHNSGQFSLGLAASWMERPLAALHADELKESLA